MQFLVINIVDRLDKVNYGIWQAAIATADVLLEKYGINTELWYPEDHSQLPEYQYGNVKLVPVGRDIPEIENPLQTIVVTHGCWQYPTRWGFALHNRGIKWVYIPHGMLEPWSLSQKWIRKFLYFNLIEKQISKRADAVRAVGKPEFNNLSSTFKNVFHIPNGCKSIPFKSKEWDTKTLQFLFMARLHKKKGILPLVNAWKESKLNNNKKYKLVIAGPDDGELQNLEKELESGTSNIDYIGLAYAQKKNSLLKNSHFYILPSFSEGFPTSVVEAMQYGLIPIISEGCNFPETFENNIAFKVSPEKMTIKNMLEELSTQNPERLSELSLKASQFITQNYSLEIIAHKQFELYKLLLGL